MSKVYQSGEEHTIYEVITIKTRFVLGRRAR